MKEVEEENVSQPQRGDERPTSDPPGAEDAKGDEPCSLRGSEEEDDLPEIDTSASVSVVPWMVAESRWKFLKALKRVKPDIIESLQGIARATREDDVRVSGHDHAPRRARRFASTHLLVELWADSFGMRPSHFLDDEWIQNAAYRTIAFWLGQPEG
jgi:hypothetical protein